LALWKDGEKEERKMGKYKTGTMYGGRAKVRIMTETGARVESVTIGGAVTEKEFDKQLTARYDFEDGDRFTHTRRIGDVEKVGAKYRVLTAELMECPSFEVVSYDGAEESTDSDEQTDY
jgi:hypothetical protein